MIQKNKKLFNRSGAVEFFIKDLVGDMDVDDVFVRQMVPMVRSIYATSVPMEKREALMTIAMGSILRRATAKPLTPTPA